MTHLVAALGRLVGPVVRQPWLAGRTVAERLLAAQREHLIAGSRVRQRRLPHPGHGQHTATG